MKVNDLMEVFQAGKEVANPAFWKQKTINANVIMTLLSGIVFIINMFDCSICDIQVTSDQLISVSTGIIAIAGMLNAGSTMATSSKVGLKTKVSSDLQNEIEKNQ